MAGQTGVKKVSVFSTEGRRILSQILQVREEKMLLENELERKKKTEEEQEASKTSGELHCLSCQVIFSDREEQVS